MFDITEEKRKLLLFYYPSNVLAPNKQNMRNILPTFDTFLSFHLYLQPSVLPYLLWLLKILSLLLLSLAN